MRYSYNWLKELSQTKKTVKELTEMVMLKGFELEEVEELKKRFDNFVVGEIISIEKHPNADKLQLVKVDVGAKKKLLVVCGASNIEVGQKVPVALIGAILPNSKIEIKKTEIRGEVSEGMLCAEDELGIGKNHAGILILNKKFENGMSLAKAIELDDTTIDFSVLPNRAHDCLSHNGMAREIAVMEGVKIKNSPCEIRFRGSSSRRISQGKNLDIKIEEKDLCSRYMGAVLENVEVKKSPRWMQNILIACGMEPINNVVDITNYVMLEIGNPLHAFDLEKIKTDKSKIDIVVRKAKKGETLVLLDDSKLKLNENDLLITNGEKPLALAGIKGGKDSGISEKTNQIVLESANFNAFNIRKSRQRHNLLTEAQARFEKSISPVLAEKGLQKAIELFEKYANARLKEIVDVNYFKEKKNIINLKSKKIDMLLGKEIDKKQAKNILENLGFEVKNGKTGEWQVGVPCWRLDIEGQEDLIEEIGRINGYEKINSIPISTIVAPSTRNRKREFEWETKNLLAGLGFDEVLSYSFYSVEEAELFKIKDQHFELENYLNPQHKLFKKTLIPGILEKVSLNVKNFDQFSIFEVGKIYNIGKNNNPEEQVLISGAFYSKNLSQEKAFYLLKGKIEEFFKKIINTTADFSSKSFGENKFSGEPFNDSAKAFIEIVGKSIGQFGIIEKNIRKFYSIKSDVVAFEICFDELFDIYEKLFSKTFVALRKYPVIERDLAMFVERKIEVAEVKKTIKKQGTDALLTCELFDVYEDEKINRKSLAFHLEFGKNERTMTGEEVDEIMKKIIKSLESEGCEVRKG